MYTNNEGSLLEVSVSSQCDGCGVCSATCKYFEDGLDGKAVPVNGGIIEKKQLSQIEEVESTCPMNAITHRIGSVIKSNGSVTKLDIKDFVQKNIIEFEYPKPQYKDFAYSGKPCFDVCVGDVHSQYVYKSYDKAVDAGFEQAKRVVFDKIKRTVVNELIKYKQSKLSPLFTFEKNQSNFYYNCNCSIENLIKSVLYEIEAISEKEIDVEKIAKIESEPDLGSNAKKFDYVSNIEYYMGNKGKEDVESPSWYKCYIDTDDMEVSEGRKCVDRYMYDINELVDTVEDHIASSLRSDIDEYFHETISGYQFKEVTKPIVEEIHEKGKKILAML